MNLSLQIFVLQNLRVRYVEMRNCMLQNPEFSKLTFRDQQLEIDRIFIENYESQSDDYSETVSYYYYSDFVSDSDSDCEYNFSDCPLRCRPRSSCDCGDDCEAGNWIERYNDDQLDAAYESDGI